MKIIDLFTATYGVNLELNACEVTTMEEGIPFVARTSLNNGVTAYVRPVDGVEPIPAGTLSCAGGGSVLATFLQPMPYYSGRDLYYLTPKKKMSTMEKIWWAYCINFNAYRYSYGRQANKTLEELKLPDGLPGYVVDAALPRVATNIYADETVPLIHAAAWQEFRLGNIFEPLGRCKNHCSGDLNDGDDLFYLGAKKAGNSVMRRVEREDDQVSAGNCLIFIGDGQGSVGYANYMAEDFIGTANLTVGYNSHLNPYVGQFLVTVLDLERMKYSFGRKWSSRIADTIIKLPAKDGEPDWNFMEAYIKSLPYSDRI